jgi:hypothetical protein
MGTLFTVSGLIFAAFSSSTLDMILAFGVVLGMFRYLFRVVLGTFRYLFRVVLGTFRSLL